MSDVRSKVPQLGYYTGVTVGVGTPQLLNFWVRNDIDFQRCRDAVSRGSFGSITPAQFFLRVYDVELGGIEDLSLDFLGAPINMVRRLGFLYPQLLSIKDYEYDP